MSDFASTIKRIRLAKGMTQEEFAVFLGTSKQNISRYEAGEVSPKITTAASMADKLGITLSQLNGSEEPTMRTQSVSVDEEALLTAFRACNAAGQQTILSVAMSVSGNPDMKKDRRQKSAG